MSTDDDDRVTDFDDDVPTYNESGAIPEPTEDADGDLTPRRALCAGLLRGPTMPEGSAGDDGR